MQEESVSDHRHERVTMQTLPGSPLEVVETEFFFQLLVSPLANPSSLMVAAKVRRSAFTGRLAR